PPGRHSRPPPAAAPRHTSPQPPRHKRSRSRRAHTARWFGFHYEDRMIRSMIPAALAVGALLVVASRAHGQIDYRNLDEGRPVATEDAYPIERFAFEVLLPYRFESERGGADLHLIAPELEFGVLANTQIGLKTVLAAVTDTGETDWGLAGIRVFGLYNFNTESSGIPALS